MLRDIDLIMLLTDVCSIKRYYELNAIIYIHCVDSLIRCVYIYILYLYYSCKFMHLIAGNRMRALSYFLIFHQY